MQAEVIFERKYQKITLDTETAAALEKPCPAIHEKRKADTLYLLIPERILSSRRFIRTAIEVSALYELDVKITRHVGHICASFSFDCGGGLRDIKRVFAMADEFAFFQGINGRDITICLDYYTHAVIRNGRVVAPDFLT